ncbi:hypothetical protein FH972_024536 [Carpinus fangiana]|uniref:Translation initiation factor eIF2B subunit delta n=1 Tax=Carpinus fangiana TaxID=176857 RepID=A0A5N6KYT9_9ROSI|nr:hypothetical protein FH972_024536 [Carpinus fangiana]
MSFFMGISDFLEQGRKTVAIALVQRDPEGWRTSAFTEMTLVRATRTTAVFTSRYLTGYGTLQGLENTLGDISAEIPVDTVELRRVAGAVTLNPVTQLVVTGEGSCCIMSDQSNLTAGTPDASSILKQASNTVLQPNGTTEASPEQPVKALSGQALKAQKKAEKAARRAQEKGDATTSTTSAATPKPGAGSSTSKAPNSQASQHKRSQSTSQKSENQQLPVRPRPSTAAREPKRENKQVSFFAHLYGPSRRHTLDGVPKEVHPQIQALGLQTSSYCVCGSHARCAAMLLALKCVVQSYTTPLGTSLPRHLSSQHLSPQLNFLKSCRPFSVSQANAIRWLKNVIATLDPSTPEPTAKADICTAIDTFIRERLTVADQVIAETAASHINDGDVVLTYAKSAVITQALRTAKRAGRDFRVVVVDSRPLFEGKNTARALADDGIDVSYSSITGLTHAARGATKCLLGAHAVLGNGRLYSRAGTALVAMMAKRMDAPVVVCAESIKFTERVALDSLAMNELGPEEELVGSEGEGEQSLHGWRDKEHLQLLNPLYDVTPAEYIAVVITELGSLPATSAPVVQRISAGAQEIV